jgi:protoporphyrinogen oxidase
MATNAVIERDIVIIGAGPTGLGAATRLHQLGHKDWLLVDAFEGPGGLACTDVTPEGFLYDMGGHVIFSHYDYFDQLIDSAVGSGEDYWNTHERVSYVRMMERWVPYPFQNNITSLPMEDQITCINGLIEAKVANALSKEKPANFDEWIMRVMGEGIANIFMRPYNFKVWAIPTTHMQCSWLGERVATANVAKVVENVIRKKEESGWGPNATFRFPKTGGTGAIWKKVGERLPAEKQKYGVTVKDFRADDKEIVMSDGTVIKYNKLMSTIPLDITLTKLGRKDLADRLTYSSTHVIGLGLRGDSPHDTKCWLYYPEDNCPFYRCTIFSHYAEGNSPTAEMLLPTIRHGDKNQPVTSEEATPRPGPYWSLMFEVSESAEHKPVNQATIVEETIQGAINTAMISSADEVVSIYYRRLEHGYPTPCLKRDACLAEALPMLKEKNIWSRGRFGSYKYEVANQDHSCMIGVEAVDNMLFGAKEFTLHHPALTNEGGKKNREIQFTEGTSIFGV